MEILGGKKQKLVEVAKKLRNPTVEKVTKFLIKSNCVYGCLYSFEVGAGAM